MYNCSNIIIQIGFRPKALRCIILPIWLLSMVTNSSSYSISLISVLILYLPAAEDQIIIQQTVYLS